MLRWIQRGLLGTDIRPCTVEVLAQFVRAEVFGIEPGGGGGQKNDGRLGLVNEPDGSHLLEGAPTSSALDPFDGAPGGVMLFVECEEELVEENIGCGLGSPFE